MNADNTKFTLTSSQFIGEVLLSFDAKGFLVMYDASGATLSENQMDWLVNELPRRIEDIKQLLGNSKTAKLTELKEQITFDMFWARYDEKIRSSKKRAIGKWNKMTETQRNKAYKFISVYESHILPGTFKKYAETYLNAELWNN